VRTSTHVLDWANQPLPFKIYSSVGGVPLPRDLPSSHAEADHLDIGLLARLCLYANGVTKTLRFPGGEMPFRAAACTGALYHVELYLVCGPLADLEAGVYHYAAHNHALDRLRAGDFRAALLEASGAEPAIAHAPVMAVLTSTWWRNAWKYQARAYRHVFWDSGTILANLLGVAAAHAVPARVVLGFADAAVNRLLDVDPEREAAVCLVALGDAAAPPAPPPPIAPLGLLTRRLSATEIDYPEIGAVHAATSLGSGEQAAAWRPGPASELTLVPLPGERAIEDVIRRRGSSRRFVHDPIDERQLTRMLAFAAQPIDSDVAALGALSEPYVIVNAVQGLESGSYVLEDGQLQPLRPGVFREVAGFLDLGQALAADAAVNVYWLADLHAVFGRLGDRGYRAAQLEAAIQAGRLYLAAYALGLGATGLTFFDDEVSRFFSPHAERKSVMFLMAIGHPARRRDVSG
jgi:SagB-type dehydrogenase family enzyme